MHFRDGRKRLANCGSGKLKENNGPGGEEGQFGEREVRGGRKEGKSGIRHKAATLVHLLLPSNSFPFILAAASSSNLFFVAFIPSHPPFKW
jgi:hypothetical protein